MRTDRINMVELLAAFLMGLVIGMFIHNIAEPRISLEGYYLEQVD